MKEKTTNEHVRKKFPVRLNESSKKAIEALATLSSMSIPEFIRQATVRAKPMSEKS